MSDGRFKKFLETWQEGDVMKRCSWNTTNDGERQSCIIPYGEKTFFIPYVLKNYFHMIKKIKWQKSCYIWQKSYYV